MFTYEPERSLRQQAIVLALEEIEFNRQRDLKDLAQFFSPADAQTTDQ